MVLADSGFRWPRGPADGGARREAGAPWARDRLRPTRLATSARRPTNVPASPRRRRVTPMMATENQPTAPFESSEVMRASKWKRCWARRGGPYSAGRVDGAVQHEDLEGAFGVEDDLAVIADHAAAGDALNRLDGRLLHRLLKAQPVVAHEILVATLDQRLLVAREAALHDAEDVVVVQKRLGLGRTLAIEVLHEPDHRVGDLRPDAVGAFALAALDVLQPVGPRQALGVLVHGLPLTRHRQSLRPRGSLGALWVGAAAFGYLRDRDASRLGSRAAPSARTARDWLAGRLSFFTTLRLCRGWAPTRPSRRSPARFSSPAGTCSAANSPSSPTKPNRSWPGQLPYFLAARRPARELRSRDSFHPRWCAASAERERASLDGRRKELTGPNRSKRKRHADASLLASHEDDPGSARAPGVRPDSPVAGVTDASFSRRDSPRPTTHGDR